MTTQKPRVLELALPRPRDTNFTFDRVLEGIDQYEARQSTALTERHRHTLNELRARLRRMHLVSRQLVEINEKLNQGAGPSVVSEGGDIFLQIGGQKFNIGRPPGVTGPLQVKEFGFVSSFNPGVPSTAGDSQLDELRRDLALKAEQFYFDGHKVFTLMRGDKQSVRLPGVRKLKHAEVSAVRNWLVEHIGDEAYTFGHGAGGPYVRPIRRPGANYYDRGLVANATDFIQALEHAFPVSESAGT